MDRLVDRLEAHCSTAAHDLVLVAPFVKQPVLQRLLASTPPATPVRIVTRWLPQEIVAGVSDLEVWDDVVARPGTMLFLRHDLHAKLYRADHRCLVGSANLTGAAVGLGSVANVELLIEVDVETPDLAGFEARLFAGAVVVDDDLVASTRAAVERLPPFVSLEEPPAAALTTTTGTAGIPAPEAWVPQLRRPEDLYTAYTDGGDTLSRASLAGAAADLAMLRLPSGLDEEAFRALVGACLLRMPVVRALDGFLVQPRRFGEVRAFLDERLGLVEPSSRVWQVLLRWLMHFAPDRYEYRRPRHSEVVARRGAD